MFFNSTSVNILREIDTGGNWWCSSAVMFSVKNGKNTIRERYGPANEDYELDSQMQINGMPVVQARLPECPTCKGMLAAGYGIENIDCPELKAARECMNSPFVSITDSAEKIKPLLGLLGDGYYVLADTICLPSDGDGRFFYDVTDDFRLYDAVCDDYYCDWQLYCVRHFPLFLYPTQSPSLINNERVEYYARMMKTDEEQPRALAYLYQGFMNLLLDGHHKACAAASIGKYVRCLTIIPSDGCWFAPGQDTRGIDLRKANPYIKTVMFAGIETEAEPGMRYLDIYDKRNKEKSGPSFRKYDFVKGGIHYGPETNPTIRDITTLLNAGSIVKERLPELDDSVIKAWIKEDTEEAESYLEAALHYLAATDHERAYKLASDILRKGDGDKRHRRVRSALLFLMDDKSEETEQLMADFYVAHEEQDENRDLVNSYWKKDEG